MFECLSQVKCNANISSHEKAVVSLSYSFDGSLLATASADSRAHIIESTTGLKRVTLEGEHSLGLNDCCWVDDKLLATASDDNTLVLWDIEMGKAITVMHGHGSYVYCVTSNPMNRTLFSGGYDGSVMIFDVTSGSCVSAFSAHSEAISSIEYSPFGDCFVTGSEDGFVRLWDSASTAGCLHTIYTEARSPISNVSYAPNGQYLVVSSLDSCHRLFSCKDGGSLQEPNGPKYLKSFKSHLNTRYSIFSSVSLFRIGDVLGSYLVSGSEDNMVYIWDLNGSETKPIVLEGHSDVVLAVACHPDPSVSQIASASKDFTVKLWDLPVRKESEEAGLEK